MGSSDKSAVGVDLLGVGLYSVSESVAVVRQRLNARSSAGNKLFLRWSNGRQELRRRYDSIIGPPIRIEGDYLFSFEQLIELLTVAAFRAKGVTHRAIRAAYKRAQQKFGDRPFAREGFRTDGIGIFTSMDATEAEELSHQQMFFEECIRPILADISYVDTRAVQFSPLGEEKSVILNPKIALGSPVDKNTGVRTAVLYAMRVADGGETDESVAQWYGVSPAAVRDAVEYEEALRRAA